jgi:hypothetical protein
MREKLNNDPRTQLIVLAVAAVAFAFVLFTMVLGGDPEPAPPATDPATGQVMPTGGTTDPAAPATGAATPADPAAGTAPVTPEAATPVVPETTPAPDAGAADGLLPGKGLPEDVLVAYARGNALALVVVDPKGIADAKVEEYTKRLSNRPDVETFVVEVGDIAKYARITQGVSVSRTPALVVVTPREKAGEVPTASVSYGFRSPKSVEIALEDALYTGKPVTSYPE